MKGCYYFFSTVLPINIRTRFRAILLDVNVLSAAVDVYSDHNMVIGKVILKLGAASPARHQRLIKIIRQ